ncbi:DUF4845 domain-containing protein [Comamonas flocculans]|uniref:DUF4845 domain-containing protein n=1 Tax=Comamonas flocculans TaxID=2597701 RepID=A0A5B8RWJ3_9BURK|nr:DUF4845 domain-containing protein [Comamonas flocculans]QEA12177.1 DUF4845 domain-containing protein [Comamonas flocculans]
MVKHRNALVGRQRGLSFLGVIFIGVFAVAAFAIGGQSVPILLEYQAIKKAATKAAREESSVAGIRAAFDRSAAIDDISSISGKDLEVTKRNDKIVVGFKYEREIALFGPAYLVYRFQDAVS